MPFPKRIENKEPVKKHCKQGTFAVTVQSGTLKEVKKADKGDGITVALYY